MQTDGEAPSSHYALISSTDILVYCFLILRVISGIEMCPMDMDPENAS